MLLKSESAAGVASGTVVFLAFLGNMFMPLTGAMLDIARFTPMYGYVGLVRYPQVEGEIQQTDPLQTDSIWLLVANYLAWLLVFCGFPCVGIVCFYLASLPSCKRKQERSEEHTRPQIGRAHV